MKFNKLIAALLIIFLVNSNMIYSYKKIQYTTKIQNKLYKNNEDKFIDPKTCEKIKEVPEEDKKLNIEIF